jgi:tRNA dimethylallyltransferase
MEVSPDRLSAARAVLIAGPTASGKSALALALAERAARAGRPAVIVNADAMQVYSELRVLTARPGAAEEGRAPHRLYGHVPAAERHSVGRWLAEAAAELEAAWAMGALPIVVGGPSLYFRALTQGLAGVPSIPDAVREALAQTLAAHGPERLHQTLRKRDPAAAASISPTDPQRMLRALEVLEATGRSIRAWQADTPPPVLPEEQALRIVVAPERSLLHARIEARLQTMLAGGALEEVRALSCLRLDPDLPAMKAIGMRALAAHLRGEIDLAEAAGRTLRETRRYAKRQTTWFRNQMPDWERWGGLPAGP